MTASLGPAPLRVQGVTVRFRGLVANSDVDLDVPAGSISALIGPNGAGKTTAFNVISGLVTPATGRLTLDDEDITRASTVRRAELGIARTFQSLQLAATLTALDNVLVGVARLGRFGRLTNVLRREALSSRDLRQIAAHALEFVGLGHRADDPVHRLPFGDRRRVELARALAAAPRLLLLDEPASGLPQEETVELINILRRARDELHTTLLVVEHDMSFVRAIAEQVVVLDFGSVLATGPTADVLADEQVVSAFLGTGSAARAGSTAAATPAAAGADATRRRRRPPLQALPVPRVHDEKVRVP
jgi:branched-chain amino acid transport system ATP-binding protein